MKILRLRYLLLCGVLLTQSCKSTKTALKNNYAFFFQDGKKTTLKENYQTVKINKGKFSLRFYNKRYSFNKKKPYYAQSATYAAQAAAFVNEFELENVKVGMQVSDVPFFAFGSGMATGINGKYESLAFNSYGHHYLMYENQDSKRVNLIDTYGDYLELEFEINGFNYDRVEVKIEDFDFDEFYIVLFIDSNLNKIIDENELKKIEVRFN